jgi:hypothetical protein
MSEKLREEPGVGDLCNIDHLVTETIQTQNKGRENKRIFAWLV